MVGCLKALQNVIERPTWRINGIWIEIVHTLRSSLDKIKGDTQQVELQILEFHAIRRFIDKVQRLVYSTPKYLLKSILRK